MMNIRFMMLLVLIGYSKQSIAGMPLKIPPVTDGLKISSNKRYLVDAITGKPVFILANTLWNISPKYDEIDTLLRSISR